MSLPLLLDGACQPVRRLAPLALSLTQRFQGVDEAEMRLPPSETPPIGALVRMTDGCGEDAGIFRVCGVTRRYGADGLCTLRLEHALALLGDQVVFGPRSVVDLNSDSPADAASDTAAVNVAIRYLIRRNQMEGIRWLLGECDFTDRYAFAYNDENLLSAVLRTLSVVEVPWRFGFDFSTDPWTLHIRAADTAVKSELRATRNLLAVSAETAREDFYTRVYPVGADDLMLPGDRHIDADTMAAWGYRCAIQHFEKVHTAQELRAVATAWLNARKQPVTAIRAEALDRWPETGERLDRLRCGEVCRIALPGDGAVLTERILTLRWPDLLHDQQRVQLTMASREASAVRSWRRAGA